MAGLSARLTAGLLACSGVLAVAACQATAVPSPYTQSAQPSVSSTAVVVTPASPSVPAPVAPALPTSPSASGPAQPGRPTPLSSLGPLRLNYRGITKLVVVKSVLNDTAAGRAAVNAVALYYSSLATATTDRSIDPARQLASPSCTQCQSDIKRIEGYIKRRERAVALDGGLSKWTTVGLFIESISSAGRVTVDLDAAAPGLRLVRSSGSVIETDPAVNFSETIQLQISDLRATITNAQTRS